jgi:hypothetical protein
MEPENLDSFMAEKMSSAANAGVTKTADSNKSFLMFNLPAIYIKIHNPKE